MTDRPKTIWQVFAFAAWLENVNPGVRKFELCPDDGALIFLCDGELLPVPPHAESENFDEVGRAMLDARDGVRLGPLQRQLLSKLLDAIDRSLEDGNETHEETRDALADAVGEMLDGFADKPN